MKYALALTVLLLGGTLASAEPTASTKPSATTEPAVTGTITVEVLQGSAGGTTVVGDLVTVELGAYGPGPKGRIIETALSSIPTALTRTTTL